MLLLLLRAADSDDLEGEGVVGRKGGRGLAGWWGGGGGGGQKKCWLRSASLGNVITGAMVEYGQSIYCVLSCPMASVYSYGHH